MASNGNKDWLWHLLLKLVNAFITNSDGLLVSRRQVIYKLRSRENLPSIVIAFKMLHKGWWHLIHPLNFVPALGLHSRFLWLMSEFLWRREQRGMLWAKCIWMRTSKGQNSTWPKTVFDTQEDSKSDRKF